jgi:hypothetical protein
MLDYINAKLGAGIVVGEDGIDALDPETLAAVAGALSSISMSAPPRATRFPTRSARSSARRSPRETGSPIPVPGRNKDEENPQALLAAATEESGVSSAVFAFVDGIGERLAGAGTSARIS